MTDGKGNNSKIENDLGGVASILADWFGGEGTADALRDATNVAKKATAGIPNRRTAYAAPSVRDVAAEDGKDDTGTLDMAECPGCGTFFVGIECGGCGMRIPSEEATTAPGKRGDARDPKWFVAFEKNGRVSEKYATPEPACDRAEQVSGYVRVMRQSELKGR